MKRLSRPDFQLYLLTLLLLAAGITIICSAAENRTEIIELLSLPAAVGFFIVVEAVIYSFTIHYRQRKWLQYVHVVSLFVFAIFAVAFLNDYLSQPEAMDLGEMEAENRRMANILRPVAILFIAGQVAFFINIVVGFAAGKKNGNNKQ